MWNQFQIYIDESKPLAGEISRVNETLSWFAPGVYLTRRGMFDDLYLNGITVDDGVYRNENTVIKFENGMTVTPDKKLVK